MNPPSTPFFVATNRHAVSCGEPPQIETARFRSYFENALREQWVCWQDDAGIHIAGGDLGWTNIMTYRPEQLLDPHFSFPYRLGSNECAWLEACLAVLLEQNGYASKRRAILLPRRQPVWG